MPERLGRYILDRKLATGGMAEIFLSRQSGPQGYERVCVIKRMLPHFCGDPQFVQMFLDEARLAAQLTHQNIAQIYDFGDAGGTYYLAMEYVPGCTLRQLLDPKLGGSRVPERAAARIISDAARALHYAHGAKDAFGKPLSIVHRDVSPHNILISRAGQVKLIDFGIAKASSAASHTTTGTVKGKYAYMSPEQALAKPLDLRTDIYSLGLVLYELLCGEKALKGESMPALMAAAAMPAFPPVEKVHPDLANALVAACNKALQPERESRYATAGELSADLERFLVQEHTTVGESDIARLVPEESADLYPREQEPTHTIEPATPFDPTYHRATPSRPAPAATEARPAQRRGGGFRWVVALGLAAAVVGGAAGTWFFRKPELAPPPAPVVVAPPAPPPAPAPAPAPPPPPAIVEEPVLAQAPSHPHHRNRPAAGEKREEPARGGKGQVVFRALPYADVFLGEKKLGETPFPAIELAAGHYQFRLSNTETGKSVTKDVTVVAGETQKVSVDLRAE